jgi:uncharacterized protein with ParB-like and HNH nuclease domain
VPTSTLICTLREVIVGRRITIPPIQRDYAWNIGNTAKDPVGSQSSRLFEDFENFKVLRSTKQAEDYFLGNLIVVVDKGTDLKSPNVEWQLLDGQQRMTSLVLMMKAFYYQLDTMNNTLARDLQNELNQACLNLDQDRFPDEAHPYPIKHRRNRDRQYFSRFMQGNIELIAKDTNMGRVAIEYHKLAAKYESSLEIQNFLEAVLDNVLVSVTITDNITMGFQMFQTANARGLPLTAYDMFRAFVVKKIESDFVQISSRRSRGLHFALDELETIFQAASWGRSDKDKEKNLKQFMSAYMSMRAGQNLSEATIIALIEDEINAIRSPDELLEYLWDMKEHAVVWKSKIHPGRPTDRDSYQFRFIRRMHRMGVKVVRGSFLSFVTNRAESESDWLLSVVEWSIIKQLLLKGQLAGNTAEFYQLAVEMNMFWDPEKAPPISGEDFENFRQLWLSERITGEQLNVLPQSFDDQNNCFYALLHRLERQDGLASDDPGRNAQTTTMIRLVSHEYAGGGYNHIGNFYLTPGSANNGLTHYQKMTHEESIDMEERILTVLDFAPNVDHNMRNELRAMGATANFEEFIAMRTGRINQALNQKYLAFMESAVPSNSFGGPDELEDDTTF